MAIQFHIKNLPLSKNSKVEKIFNNLFRRGRRKTLSFNSCEPFKHLTHTTGGFCYILSSDFYYSLALELGMIKSSEWAGLGASTPPTAPSCIWLTNSAQGNFLQIKSQTHPHCSKHPSASQYRFYLEGTHEQPQLHRYSSCQTAASPVGSSHGAPLKCGILSSFFVSELGLNTREL